MATTARPPGQKSDYLITNRRREEDLRNLNLETTQYYARTDMKSRFEESTGLAIQRKHIRRKFNELKNAESLRLEERRDRLRQLLQNDEERFRQQLMAREETAESRVEAMRARMNELKEQRERERKAIVDEKLLQRWRKECDQLRAAESKMLEKRIAHERGAQLVEQESRKQQERKENEYYDMLWEQDRQKKIDREEKDRLHQKTINEVTLKALHEQLDALKARVKLEQELKQQEAALMREEHEMRLLEDERQHQRKLQEQRLIRQDLDDFNKMRLLQRQQDIQAQLEMDMRILSEFLKLEKLEKETKQRRREDLRREMQMYREHLLMQKNIERQREIEVEKGYTEEQNRLWKARSEKWRKEQAARDNLMKEVMEGRKEQLRYALERNHQAQEQVRLEKLQIEKHIAEAKSHELATHEKIAKTKKEYSHMLLEQIEAAELRKLEDKRRAEQEYQAEC
eukprot:jgi/Hompol1/156/HPOL_003888-RA